MGPSTLLTSYFVIITLSDVTQAGLLYVAWNLCNPWGLTSAISATRFVLLVLEGQTKRSILREPYDKLAPEETAGFFGVAFFWWVNKVLKTGYSKVLSLDDMPPLGRSLDVMKTREAMQREWDKRSKYTWASAFNLNTYQPNSEKPEGRFSLMLAQLKCLWRPNIYIFVPRFIFIVLRCCQPLLISRAITFVSKDLPPFENRNEAFRLILLTFVIYTGMAVRQMLGASSWWKEYC